MGGAEAPRILTVVLGAILTAIVTPFRDGQLDERAFRVLIDYLLSSGSDGIVVAGTTGEASTLTDPERLRLIEIAVEQAHGRGSVVAGTGSNDTLHSVHMTREARALGADAALIVTPYYNRPPRAGIIGHFAAVAAEGLPIVAYNIPGRTGLNMAPDLLAELARIPEVVAVKQANEDLAQSRAILADTDLVLYAGNDDLLLPVLEMGGRGVMSVASHLVGQKFQEMVAAAERGDIAHARDVDAELHDLYVALFETTNPILIKSALAQCGLIPSPELRLPLVEATAAERDRLARALEAYGVLGMTKGAT